MQKASDIIRLDETSSRTRQTSLLK